MTLLSLISNDAVFTIFSVLECYIVIERGTNWEQSRSAYCVVGTGALGAFTRAALVAGRLEGDLTGNQKSASCAGGGHIGTVHAR